MDRREKYRFNPRYDLRGRYLKRVTVRAEGIGEVSTDILRYAFIANLAPDAALRR